MTQKVDPARPSMLSYGGSGFLNCSVVQSDRDKASYRAKLIRNVQDSWRHMTFSPNIGAYRGLITAHTRLYGNLINCKVSSGPTPTGSGGTFDMAKIAGLASAKKLPSTTAQLALAEAAAPAKAVNVDESKVYTILPNWMIQPIIDVAKTLGVTMPTAKSYLPLTAYNIRSSSTAQAIAGGLRLNLANNDQFLQLLPSDTPPDTGVDLFTSVQGKVDNALLQSRMIDYGTVKKNYVQVQTEIFAEPWVAKEVIATDISDVTIIPIPNQRVFDAIASSTISELIAGSDVVTQRANQFFFIVLLQRFPAVLPERFMRTFTGDRAAFSLEFSLWLNSFITQEILPAKYLRALYTYLRISSQSSDKYDFGILPAEKRACLLLSGLQSKITQNASLLTANNRLTWSKAQLQVVRDIEASEIAKLERDFPVYRISNILYQDIPFGMQSQLSDIIYQYDKSAGQRAKALTLRAWKAMEYLNFINTVASGTFSAVNFNLICEKPLKSIIP